MWKFESCKIFLYNTTCVFDVIDSETKSRHEHIWHSLCVTDSLWCIKSVHLLVLRIGKMKKYNIKKNNNNILEIPPTSLLAFSHSSPSQVLRPVYWSHSLYLWSVYLFHLETWTPFLPYFQTPSLFLVAVLSLLSAWHSVFPFLPLLFGFHQVCFWVLAVCLQIQYEIASVHWWLFQVWIYFLWFVLLFLVEFFGNPPAFGLPTTKNMIQAFLKPPKQISNSKGLNNKYQVSQFLRLLKILGS